MSSDLEEEKTPERVGHYVDLVLSADSANLGVPLALSGFVEEAMAPYWDGTKSYDECYDRLLNILELYKDE